MQAFCTGNAPILALKKYADLSFFKKNICAFTLPIFVLKIRGIHSVTQLTCSSDNRRKNIRHKNVPAFLKIANKKLAILTSFHI